MTAKEDKQNDRLTKLELDSAGIASTITHINEKLGEIKELIKGLATKEEITRINARLDSKATKEELMNVRADVRELLQWKNEHENAFREIAIKLGAISSSIAIVTSIVLSQLAQ